MDIDVHITNKHTVNTLGKKTAQHLLGADLISGSHLLTHIHVPLCI